VPVGIYTRAERVAKKHGMNRSQFYTAAADRYADELESADLTESINVVVDASNAHASTSFAVAVGRRVLGEADEGW